MSVELNHTIIGARDKHKSARFLCGVSRRYASDLERDPVDSLGPGRVG
ncbi:hypothetical protein [Saccharopolyspora phatthalungensis]|uniref:Uncharacterized protein n=1 Tax=Saccharopolyspora phatthalungensis TaxID=664693 RepID=A0A840QFF7_9PSEU|nr:hypothetical protein [Saccharopolyspora phatthalungensis]MBB5157215.1 hypothetical protein [Saccharopolyspora phatthalungensis]